MKFYLYKKLGFSSFFVCILLMNISCSDDDDTGNGNDTTITALSELGSDEQFKNFVIELNSPPVVIPDLEEADSIFNAIARTGTLQDTDQQTLLSAFGYANLQDFETYANRIIAQGASFYQKYDLKNRPQDSLDLYLKPIIEDLTNPTEIQNVLSTKILKNIGFSTNCPTQNERIREAGRLDLEDQINGVAFSCHEELGRRRYQSLLDYFEKYGEVPQTGFCVFPDPDNICKDEVLRHFLNDSKLTLEFYCCLVTKYELIDFQEDCCKDLLVS
ncbi:hypothetical protein J8281_06970 [Aquimarina sp. U1-2]|uniref:hypothetical protein n=1 Tax=Aquimarina sp. U1-2 TaxID=2823141 RepID=UPI001AECAABD|nr:hypothetical protein [Aquimarina sp. U1-2]MBP2831927.1 hypothetical protein [Aquimarina sp. U1-2]